MLATEDADRCAGWDLPLYKLILFKFEQLAAAGVAVTLVSDEQGPFLFPSP